MRVLIIDDVPLFRVGLRSTLEQMGDCSIIGESIEASEILELARMQHPDVVLLHGGLRSGNAFEIACLLLRQVQQRGLFVLAPSGNEEQVFQFFKAGAAAYETRAIMPTELTDKMRRVAHGEYLITSEAISPTHPARPIRALDENRESAEKPSASHFPLSHREMEMLEYMARGKSNKEIAKTLRISDQTVKNHITSILKKLQVNDRTAAVVYALRRHWIRIGTSEEEQGQYGGRSVHEHVTSAS